MTRKRERGTFRRLPSGRWQVRYTGPDGMRRTMDRTFRTKADAEAEFSLVLGQMLSGRWINPDLALVTVAVYAKRWIAERAGLSQRTRELYSTLLRRHVAPYLGGVQLRRLTAEHVRNWRQNRIDAGVGPSTVAKSYRLLRAVCATAVDDELLHRNPCRIRGAGAEHATERPVLTLTEVMLLADCIDPRLRLMVLLAVFGSLRWGELLGLTREDIDLNAMTVQVRRAVAEVGGQLVIKMPKTVAGRRVVALPVVMRDEITRHLDEFAEPGPSGRVIVGEKGATPRRAHFVKKWSAAKEAAGVAPSVHFHDLRHTGNHFAASSGASTRELMSRMGHASMRAAIIYQHATAHRDRAIANAMDRLVEDASPMNSEGGEEA